MIIAKTIISTIWIVMVIFPMIMDRDTKMSIKLTMFSIIVSTILLLFM